MAVFEILQPVLKDASHASEIGRLLRTNIGELPGVQSYNIVKASQVSGADAPLQGGTHFILVWDKLESILEVFKSSALARLKEATEPLVNEMPRPLLFRPGASIQGEDADATLKSITDGSTHIHMIKVAAPKGAQEDVKAGWDAFATAIKGADGLTGVFAGEGLLHDAGGFVGLTGWKSRAALDEALNKVEAAAAQLEAIVGDGASSTYIYDL